MAFPLVWLSLALVEAQPLAEAQQLVEARPPVEVEAQHDERAALGGGQAAPAYERAPACVALARMLV